MHQLASFLVLISFPLISLSQTLVVIDEIDEHPISGVNIQVPRSSTGLITTDASGKADLIRSVEWTKLRFKKKGYQITTLGKKEIEELGYVIRLQRVVSTLDEQVVTTYKEEKSRYTSVNVTPLSLEDAEKEGAFNLSGSLARLPGVDQLSTGNSISKPVIRGLYGNRVLVLFSGLRFDNQQWQDEHGLGLSDMGISKVELIKGPLSLLYGTDAIGGVVNIIEETAPAKGTSMTDVKLDLHSNTAGGTLQVGTKSNFGDVWYRLRAGVTNHTDYTDGNGDRVLNSRFNGYNLKASVGIKKKNWSSENHYHFSYNHFGFIFNDVSHFMEVDKRWTRKMNGPHHIVMLNSLSSINQIRLKKSLLKFNIGIQSNMRSEDEGGGELSLRMHLTTLQYALKWNKPLTKHILLILANNSSVENNYNFGRRLIVPDAWMAETAGSAYLKHHYKNVVLEYGLGAGMRYIKTLLTNSVNSEEKEIAPFAQIRPFFNAMLGSSFLLGKKWNIKLNASTGVRAPNLAELSANGLHEGIYTYEVGDPEMKNEQNLNADLGIFHTGSRFQFSASTFYNHFMGYIYLQPTGGEWFGFPRYNFVQDDAQLYGGEISASYSPSSVEGLQVSLTGSGMIGKLYQGDYLPYMPAISMRPELRYDYSARENFTGWVFLNSDLVRTQDKLAPTETRTPGYQLVNAGIGFNIPRGKVTYQVQVVANNLLNQAYYSHMSRFKYMDLLNMGRDISLQLKVKFPGTTGKNSKKHKSGNPVKATKESKTQHPTSNPN